MKNEVGAARIRRQRDLLAPRQSPHLDVFDPCKSGRRLGYAGANRSDSLSQDRTGDCATLDLNQVVAPTGKETNESVRHLESDPSAILKLSRGRSDSYLKPFKLKSSGATQRLLKDRFLFSQLGGGRKVHPVTAAALLGDRARGRNTIGAGLHEFK
jgi:hypothetical protein